MSINSTNGHSGPPMEPHHLSQADLALKGSQLADTVLELESLTKKRKALMKRRDELAEQIHEKVEMVEAPMLPFEGEKRA